MNSQTGLAPKVVESPSRGSTIRFTVAGLIGLCASLVATSVGVTHFLENRTVAPPSPVVPTAASTVTESPTTSPDAPWGRLVTMDVDIQQPEEYVAFDTTPGSKIAWVFPGMSLGQVKELLKSSGLGGEQLASALTPENVVDEADAVTVKPGEALLFGLTPEVRAKLYNALAKWPQNKFMNSPYHLPGNFEEMAKRSGVSDEIVALVGKLTYQNCGIRFFSDPELVLSKIASRDDQLLLLKALTYQTAVLARLHLDEKSDIDKIVGYWASVPGVRDKDVRPLLDSVARTQGGGTISLLYLLPKFARERLYTFPMPTQTGDTQMDCHWTALNFLNETPDNRLQDSAFASQYIKENFYQIGKPSKPGDVLFILDSSGEVIHSAVYIAGDIVFTKNGVNYAQPWILMRTKDLMDVYTRDQAPTVLHYRRKDT
jgi:hypothetical protein